MIALPCAGGVPLTRIARGRNFRPLAALGRREDRLCLPAGGETLM